MARAAKVKLQVDDKDLSRHAKVLKSVSAAGATFISRLKGMQEGFVKGRGSAKSLIAAFNESAASARAASSAFAQTKETVSKTGVAFRSVAEATKKSTSFVVRHTTAMLRALKIRRQTNKEMDRSSKSYSSFINKSTKVFIAQRMIARGFGVMKNAAQKMDMEVNMTRQIEGFGRVVEEVMDKTQGALTRGDVVEILTTMNSFGMSLAGVGDELARMQKLAIRNGKDLQTSLSDYARGLGRLSPMILDNLGIQVSLSEASKEYAESMGIAVKEMTKSQKIDALRVSIEKQTKALIDGVDAANSYGVALARMEAKWKSFKDSTGRTLMPIVGGLLGVMEKSASGWESMLASTTEEIRLAEINRFGILKRGYEKEARLAKQAGDKMAESVAIGNIAELNTLKAMYAEKSKMLIEYLDFKSGKGAYSSSSENKDAFFGSGADEAMERKHAFILMMTAAQQAERKALTGMLKDTLTKIELEKALKGLRDQQVIKQQEAAEILRGMTADQIDAQIENYGMSMEMVATIAEEAEVEHDRAMRRSIEKQEAMAELVGGIKDAATEWKEAQANVNETTTAQVELTVALQRHKTMQREINKLLKIEAADNKSITAEETERLRLLGQKIKEIRRWITYSQEVKETRKLEAAWMARALANQKNMTQAAIRSELARLGGIKARIKAEELYSELLASQLNSMAMFNPLMYGIRKSMMEALLGKIEDIERLEKLLKKKGPGRAKQKTEKNKKTELPLEVFVPDWEKLWSLHKNAFENLRKMRRKMATKLSKAFWEGLAEDDKAGALLTGNPLWDEGNITKHLERLETLRKKMEERGLHMEVWFPTLEKARLEWQNYAETMRDVANATDTVATTMDSMQRGMTGLFHDDVIQQFSGIQEMFEGVSDAAKKNANAYGLVNAALPGIRQFTRGLISDRKAQAAVEMIMQTAAGSAAMAIGNVGAGGLHYAAAAAYGLVAGGVIPLPPEANKSRQGAGNGQAATTSAPANFHFYLQGQPIFSEASAGVWVNEAMDAAASRGLIPRRN